MGELILLLLILYLVFSSYRRAEIRKWEYERRRRRTYRDSHQPLKPETSPTETITLEDVRQKGEAPQETLPLPPTPSLGRYENEGTLVIKIEEAKEGMAYPKEPTITLPGDLIKEKSGERRYAREVKKAKGERKIASGDLYKGIIYAEILGPPRAKKPWFPINGTG